MGYSIGQVAEIIGLTAHTLRFYDKEGLLPFVQKSSSGLRIFSESDIEWLLLIECLKETGMTLKDIKRYIDWFREGDSTLGQRLEMFEQQKLKVEAQIAQFKHHLEKINYKIAYYNEAVAHGSIDAAKHSECLNEMKKQVFAAAKKK